MFSFNNVGLFLAVRRRNAKRDRACNNRPPLPTRCVLPLACVEKIVMETVGFTDVDDMYSKIRTFMLEENKQAKKKIFENIKSMTEEEAIMSVGKFLMQGRT